jgi:hypothetical protein
VAVVPLERGDQGGSNGGGLTEAVAVLAEIRRFENGSGKKTKKSKMEVSGY